MTRGRTRSNFTILLAFAWPAVAAFAGCNAPPGPAPSCATTSDCPSGTHCSPAGVCSGDVACLTDPDCCLGETCEHQKCRPRQMCSPGQGCGDPGKSCEAGLCVPKTCINDAACGEGRTCLWGRCAAGLPCGGACGVGQACSILVDHCVALSGSPSACPSGRLRVLSNDADLLTEGCSTRPQQTTCRLLPPVVEGEVGLPGVLLHTGNSLTHLAYDRTYGDLLATTYSAAPPFDVISSRTIVGLPEPGVVLGDPDGPRLGILAPGPDKGEAFDAAVLTDGAVAVAFRDKDTDELRFLRYSADGGPWPDHVIAKEPGAGTTLALALLPSGAPVVAAFTPARSDPTAPSQLRLYAAKSLTPQTASDWQVLQVASDTVPAPLPSPFRDVPAGRGAWLDLAVGGDGAIALAAYSATAGDLVLYRGTLTQGLTGKLVNRQQIPSGSSDFGRFVSLALRQDGLAWMACEDTAGGRLLLVREVGADFQVDVLDDGRRDDGLHRVGADAALMVHSSGGAMVAYQDTRVGDLLWVRVSKAGATPERQTLATQALAGFSPTIVALGSKAWALASTTVQVTPKGEAKSAVRVQGLVWSGE